MSRQRLGWILMILVLLNLAFIWCNSLLPAEVSGAISTKVKEILLKLIPGQRDAAATGNYQLRKWAHFLEFCCLGMLLCGLAQLRGGLTFRKLLYCWIGGVSVACADEIIQRFVPGRGPALIDVGIDTLGVTLGIGIISLVYCVKKRKQFGGK